VCRQGDGHRARSVRVERLRRHGEDGLRGAELTRHEHADRGRDEVDALHGERLERPGGNAHGVREEAVLERLREATEHHRAHGPPGDDGRLSRARREAREMCPDARQPPGEERLHGRVRRGDPHADTGCEEHDEVSDDRPGQPGIRGHEDRCGRACEREDTAGEERVRLVARAHRERLGGPEPPMKQARLDGLRRAPPRRKDVHHAVSHDVPRVEREERNGTPPLSQEQARGPRVAGDPHGIEHERERQDGRGAHERGRDLVHADATNEARDHGEPEHRERDAPRDPQPCAAAPRRVGSVRVAPAHRAP